MRRRPTRPMDRVRRRLWWLFPPLLLLLTAILALAIFYVLAQK